jgi:excisionase family DNA binding protein
MSEGLLTVQEVADYLGVPRATIYAWRRDGIGPAGYRVGRHIRYRREHVEAWLEQQRDPEPTA